ncbi:hypothetical protein AB837_00398 [bacterium AB1]|nr:hypothetical protein AB837_00398 [bacterium AB1]
MSDLEQNIQSSKTEEINYIDFSKLLSHLLNNKIFNKDVLQEDFNDLKDKISKFLNMLNAFTSIEFISENKELIKKLYTDLQNSSLNCLKNLVMSLTDVEQEAKEVFIRFLELKINLTFSKTLQFLIKDSSNNDEDVEEKITIFLNFILIDTAKLFNDHVLKTTDSKTYDSFISDLFKQEYTLAEELNKHEIYDLTKFVETLKSYINMILNPEGLDESSNDEANNVINILFQILQTNVKNFVNDNRENKKLLSFVENTEQEKLLYQSVYQTMSILNEKLSFVQARGVVLNNSHIELIAKFLIYLTINQIYDSTVES